MEYLSAPRGLAGRHPLDLSGPYRKIFEDSLDHVARVADPFHLVKLANTEFDECRRRVQNETVGHPGRKEDPLYRARRLPTRSQLTGGDHRPLAAGDRQLAQGLGVQRAHRSDQQPNQAASTIAGSLWTATSPAIAFA